jgi:hypothetical protein
VLYRPEAFEPLTDKAWDEGRARDAISTIIADTDAAYDQANLWPAHDWDGWMTPLPLKTLYAGAAGVLWALDVLRQRGYAETRLDLAAAARQTLDAWSREPDFMAEIELPERRDAGLLSGESGILVVAWLLTRDDELADRLLARVHENEDNDADDLMWGTPGTLLAARTLLDRTGDARWADAWRAGAEALMRRRGDDALWTQHLYGHRYRGLAPPHGVVGNVLPLLGGGGLLAEDARATLERETGEILERTAVAEDGLANWPMAVGEELTAEDGQIRVQWDCGAPGVVAAASSYLDEELLVAGAELAWQAGPAGMEKGACMCHGTAGNGYAFLKVYDRTGDEEWLHRARRFAVHALGQVERARAERGRGRYSLWTGDLGVALYAADCLDGLSAYPVVDGWG